ncbi:diguanylate cyclase [Ammonifex thiophilus]|uniref:GGDEF domain-containing protein n=1 Tax=Ammonifex thiophilus TaxID=444093 RepID=A0A3D8P811_9THEO|nr:diguanylate cyclase [Ammonifex thiophilus]RDV84665.1 GGDEF domain-containing protein [Ammonifex thiophilus]
MAAQLSSMMLELLALYEITSWRFPHSEEEILLWFIDKTSRLFGVTGFSVEVKVPGSPAPQVWRWGKGGVEPQHRYSWRDAELELEVSFVHPQGFDERARRLLNVLGCQLGQNLRTFYWYRRLQYLTCHDCLTGLPNRAYFEAELERLKETFAYPVSFIVCDLDNLKEANDSRGHSFGDELLRAAARLIKESVRESDVVARVGGDEFVVVLPRTGRQAALKVARRIKKRLAAHNTQHPHLPLSISVGAGTASSPERLRQGLDEADRAMYRNKVRHKEAVKRNGSSDPTCGYILRRQPGGGVDRRADL